MKHIVMLTAVLLFVGSLAACSKKESPEVICEPVNSAKDSTVYLPMTNDNIISETNKCEEAGLKAISLINKEQFGSRVVFVQCEPK